MLGLFGKKPVAPAAAPAAAPTTVYSVKVEMKDGKLDLKLKKNGEVEYREPSYLVKKSVDAAATPVAALAATEINSRTTRNLPSKLAPLGDEISSKKKIKQN